MTYGRGRTYRKVEIIGISRSEIEDAILQAVTKAQESLEKLQKGELVYLTGLPFLNSDYFFNIFTWRRTL